MPFHCYGVRCFYYHNKMSASIIRINLGSSVIKNTRACITSIEYLYRQYAVKCLYDPYKLQNNTHV
jgi:hypothetical protein